MNGFETCRMFTSARAPLMLQPESSARRDLAQLGMSAATALSESLLEHGALLFRGFAVQDVPSFKTFLDVISSQRADYVYRSTPRTAVGDRIFTATEYPPTQEIPLHNENAYQRSWPLKVAFCCLVAARQGGATPLADMREVTCSIGARVLDRFESLGVKYVRHYRPYVDLSWQTVFQTDDRAQVARYCAENGLEHQWLDADTLRTSQVSQGVAIHPVTEERLFFNQAHLFHVSSLGAESAELLRRTYGGGLPRHACYGNGKEIPDADLEVVRAAFRQHAVAFPWQPGDVLLLDNMQVAHGRQPFVGERRIVAALLDPSEHARQHRTSGELHGDGAHGRKC